MDSINWVKAKFKIELSRSIFQKLIGRLGTQFGVIRVFAGILWHYLNLLHAVRNLDTAHDSTSGAKSSGIGANVQVVDTRWLGNWPNELF